MKDRRFSICLRENCWETKLLQQMLTLHLPSSSQIFRATHQRLFTKNSKWLSWSVAGFRLENDIVICYYNGKKKWKTPILKLHSWKLRSTPQILTCIQFRAVLFMKNNHKFKNREGDIDNKKIIKWKFVRFLKLHLSPIGISIILLGLGNFSTCIKTILLYKKIFFLFHFKNPW